VTAGTIFHRTRKPLRVWFLGVFFLARHKTGISALQFQKDAGLGNYQTAWTMLHKLRSALGPRPQDKLTGLVEADESYIGGKEPGLRGGRTLVGKTLVALAVEHREHSVGPSTLTTRRCAPMRFKATAASGWSGSITNGSFRGRTLPDRLRSCRGFIASSETSRRGCAERFHGVSRKHLPGYLAEFSYRFDRRWREEKLFCFVLRRAARGAPLPYNRLVAE